MTAEGLLADCRARGIELIAVGDRLRWRSRARLPPELLARLRDHKAVLLAALRPRACRTCGSPTDDRRRCWRCCDRPCVDCGRPTGSAFIQRCPTCGNRLNDNSGRWARE